MPPASLTKLMTVLLAADSGRSGDTVTVSRTAAAETGTRVGLRAGERWRLADLMAASLMASGNDACRAVAEHLGGDQLRFVSRMNQQAAELGLRDTHFTNACGHDDPQHYASAADLLKLAHAVLARASLREMAMAQALTISSVGMNPARELKLVNTNALLGRQTDVVGLKTGSTPRAGACLVAVARRNGHEVVLVMLKGRDRWWDAADILDIALARALAGS